MSIGKNLTERLDKIEVSWTCRFHPHEGWHEVGCPHQEWTKEQILGALISKKKFEQAKLAGTPLFDFANIKPNHGKIHGIQ